MQGNEEGPPWEPPDARKELNAEHDAASEGLHPSANPERRAAVQGTLHVKIPMFDGKERPDTDVPIWNTQRFATPLEQATQ